MNGWKLIAVDGKKIRGSSIDLGSCQGGCHKKYDFEVLRTKMNM